MNLIANVKILPLIIISVCPLLASAQLAVTVSTPKVTGQKTVVTLAMTNNLGEKSNQRAPSFSCWTCAGALVFVSHNRPLTFGD
jgi:hypothetical protein